MRSSGHSFIQCDLVSLQKRKFAQIGVEGRLRKKICVCKPRRNVSEETALLASGPPTSGLHNCEKNFARLGPPVLVLCCGSPGKGNTVQLNTSSLGRPLMEEQLPEEQLQFHHRLTSHELHRGSGRLQWCVPDAVKLLLSCSLFSCTYTPGSLAAPRPMQSSDKDNFLFKTVYWQTKPKY